MNELVEQQNLPTIDPATQDTALMSIIERASLDPNMDIGKLEKLLDLKDRWDEKQSRLLFDEAMARVQANILPVVADAENTQTRSRYAKLKTIVESLSPIYTEEGFSVSFGTEDCPGEKLREQGWFRITSKLSHSGGFTKNYHVDLPLDIVGQKGTRNKTDIHGTKSALTYARGMLMGMMFNFTTSLDVDDDGNAAGFQAISDEQAATIYEYFETIAEWDKDKTEKFLSWLKASEVEYIPADRYDAAIAFLKKKAAA